MFVQKTPGGKARERNRQTFRVSQANGPGRSHKAMTCGGKTVHAHLMVTFCVVFTQDFAGKELPGSGSAQNRLIFHMARALAAASHRIVLSLK